MPLFKSHNQPPPPPSPPQSPPDRSRSLFSRKRDNSDPYNNYDNSYDDDRNGSSRGGFFSRRRSSSSSSGSRSRSHDLKKDPSILAARQKVADAENSEREADRALGMARTAVREARQHVQMLEREALEE